LKSSGGAMDSASSVKCRHASLYYFHKVKGCFYLLFSPAFHYAFGDFPAESFFTVFVYKIGYIAFTPAIYHIHRRKPFHLRVFSHTH